MKRYAKIANEETKQVLVGIGTDTAYYESIGMSEQEVEEAYNGNWYLKGYAPEKPAETLEEIKQKRAAAYLRQTDALTAEYTRKSLLGVLTEEEEKEIKEKLQTISMQIQENYPYNP